MAALILFGLLFFLFGLRKYCLSSKLLPFLFSLLPSKPAQYLPPKKTLPPTHKTLFSTFDSNGDGFISPSELHSSLLRLGLHSSSADLANLIRSVDADGDGLIDPVEFADLCASIGSDDPKAAAAAGGEDDDDRGIREAFQVFDGNGDGLITVEELSSVLKSLGLGRDGVDLDCRGMIQVVDLDGDGMVDFDEFKRMMQLDGGKGNFF